MEKNLATILSVIILVIAILAIGVYFFNQNTKNQETNMNQQNQEELNNQTQTTEEMKIEIIKEGEGEEVKSGDQITVNYVGMLEDGTIFDSSIERGQPFPFTIGIGGVIQGWEIGVIGMKVGETRKLTIPSQLAYGERGVSGVIPPNSTLIFEINLLKIN
ncbi:MAG: FKBP-type peptidyl-prolyl cis-trans isomerase [Sphaerochaetaceae bacterium]|nr:FKBP-type peptidyl-prolyl cis-trans isomerase [Sphaerochaetaceae bacterium]